MRSTCGTSSREIAKSRREALGLLLSYLAAQEDTDEARTQPRECVEKLAQETGWYHDMVGIFVSALRYTHYGFVTRYLMKRVSRDKGKAGTDTSHAYEYTDWNDVRHFAEEFLEVLPVER